MPGLSCVARSVRIRFSSEGWERGDWQGVARGVVLRAAVFVSVSLGGGRGGVGRLGVESDFVESGLVSVERRGGCRRRRGMTRARCRCRAWGRRG